MLAAATYSDSSQQTFGHVSHDDTNQEDDSIQPIVAQDEGDDEECDAQEDGHARDDVDEVVDLLMDGGLAHLQPGGQVSDTTHHSVVSRAHHDATTRTCQQEKYTQVSLIGGNLIQGGHYLSVFMPRHVPASNRNIHTCL